MALNLLQGLLALVFVLHGLLPEGGCCCLTASSLADENRVHGHLHGPALHTPPAIHHAAHSGPASQTAAEPALHLRCSLPDGNCMPADACFCSCHQSPVSLRPASSEFRKLNESGTTDRSAAVRPHLCAVLQAWNENMNPGLQFWDKDQLQPQPAVPTSGIVLLRL